MLNQGKVAGNFVPFESNNKTFMDSIGVLFTNRVCGAVQELPDISMCRSRTETGKKFFVPFQRCSRPVKQLYLRSFQSSGAGHIENDRVIIRSLVCALHQQLGEIQKRISPERQTDAMQATSV